MKKKLSILLTTVVLLGALGVPAYAAGASTQASVPDPSAFYCKKCGNLGDIKQTWSEYNYYGIIMWYYVECSCGNSWTYAYQMNAADPAPSATPST